MYFPYLYGRQSELLALRDVSAELARWGNVVPVVEPVKDDSGDLIRCLNQLKSANAKLFLIVNPSHGRFQEDELLAQWTADTEDHVADSDLTIPTFQISGPADGVSSLDSFIAQFAGRPVGIVVRSSDISAVDLEQRVRDLDATVFVHASANPRTYLRTLPADKVVEVVSSFNSQGRNADYFGTEWFTNGHLEFTEDGRPGFSDFALLPNSFKEGGGQAAAVAVHLSYVNHSDGASIWVEHYVSDSTEIGDGDTAKKMSEAIAKIHADSSANPAKYESTIGLTKFLSQHADESPTGLATSKRQQLAHHLATVASAF